MARSYYGMDFAEFVALAEKTVGGVLLDVRPPTEYMDGHLPHSINLPLAEICSINMPKDTTLFVYCHDGTSSAKASSVLRRMGYKAQSIGGIYGYRGRIVRSKR